jgi:hypothetical protein
MKKHNTVKKSAGNRKGVNRKLTVGIDMGNRSSRYCILDEQGEVLAEGSVATTQKGFAQVFGSKRRSRIASEVGTHSPWVSRHLAELGHEVIVANPRRVRLITDSSRKDDRLDAKTLARLARIDPELLSPIRHRSEQAQADLMVIRAQAALGTAARSAISLQHPSDLRTPTGTKPIAAEKSANGSGAMRRGPLRVEAGPRQPAIRSSLRIWHRGHPSRLPSGSLRSAWTGPGRDAGTLSATREWQAMNEFA